MEFLKGILSEETYNKLVEELKDKKEVKLANLATGEYVSKNKADEQLKKLTAELETLKKGGAKTDTDDWETKYNKLMADTEKQINESKEKFNRYRLNNELKALGAKNTKAVLGLIDVSKLDFDTEDKIGGLDELIKECKKSDAYLFDTPAGDVKPGSGMTTTNDQKKAEPKVIPQVI